MVPMADLHVHLLAALDDGPRTMEDAVAMCRMAYQDGTRLMAATSHQNQRWNAVTPEIIRDATEKLRAALEAEGVHIKVWPNAEITAQPMTGQDWDAGKLLSVGDRGHYLLVELPHGAFVDLMPMVQHLRSVGVRTILAHPEKEPEFLHGEGQIEALLEAGCLVQVSASSITDPKHHGDRTALRDWFKRGMVHLLASDGHSPKRRLPLMAAAYREVEKWIGTAAADRIAGEHGSAILNGFKLRVKPPLAPKKKSFWFAWW